MVRYSKVAHLGSNENRYDSLCVVQATLRQVPGPVPPYPAVSTRGKRL